MALLCHLLQGQGIVPITVADLLQGPLHIRMHTFLPLRAADNIRVKRPQPLQHFPGTALGFQMSVRHRNFPVGIKYSEIFHQKHCQAYQFRLPFLFPPAGTYQFFHTCKHTFPGIHFQAALQLLQLFVFQDCQVFFIGIFLCTDYVFPQEKTGLQKIMTDLVIFRDVPVMIQLSAHTDKRILPDSLPAQHLPDVPLRLIIISVLPQKQKHQIHMSVHETVKSRPVQPRKTVHDRRITHTFHMTQIKQNYLENRNIQPDSRQLTLLVQPEGIGLTIDQSLKNTVPENHDILILIIHFPLTIRCLRGFQAFIQLIHINGFQTIINNAVLKCFLYIFKLIIGAYDNDKNVGIFFLDPADQFQSRQPRHAHIRQQQVYRGFLQIAQRLPGVCGKTCHLAIINLPFHLIDQPFHNGRFVVNNIYFQTVCIQSPVPPFLPSSLRGASENHSRHPYAPFCGKFPLLPVFRFFTYKNSPDFSMQKELLYRQILSSAVTPAPILCQAP